MGAGASDQDEYQVTLEDGRELGIFRNMKTGSWHQQIAVCVQTITRTAQIRPKVKVAPRVTAIPLINSLKNKSNTKTPYGGLVLNSYEFKD